MGINFDSASHTISDWKIEQSPAWPVICTKRITAAGLHDWLLLSYSIWIKLAYDLCLLFCLFAIIVPKILSNWLISIKKCYIPLFLLIIRYSYRVLPLLTVHTVISTMRSAWRDLSTTLEMTTCWFIIAVWIADNQLKHCQVFYTIVGMQPIKAVTDSIMSVSSHTITITRPGCHLGALKSMMHWSPE